MQVYKRRKGLKGPWTYPNGRTLYFDPVAMKYWDPRTDFFVDDDEVNDLKASLFTLIKGV